MSSTITSSGLITPLEADDEKPVMPQLPVAFRPLSPFVDIVAGANLSMFSKSLLGFLGGAIMLLLLGTLCLLILSQMDKRVEELSVAQEKIDLARQMKNDVTSQMHYRAAALLTGDEAYNLENANANAAFLGHLERLQSIDPKYPLVSFDQLRKSSEMFDEAGHTTVGLYDSGEIEQATAFYFSDEYPISRELEAATDSMIEGTTLEWTKSKAAFYSDRGLLTKIVLLFSGLAVAAGIFMGVVMSWSYIRPIRLIGSVLSKVAAGDFTQIVKVNNRDELGSLAIDVNSMSRRLDTLYHDLEEAHRQVVASEKLATLGQMSGGIAHDLRNPLGVIKNATYLLDKAVSTNGNLDSDSNSKVRRNIDTINTQIDRAERTVADLMDYTGGHILQGQPTDLNDLVRDCLSNLIGTDGVEIVQTLDPDMPMVICDSDQIRRVFVNLAINACDAMPKGGHLTVSTRTDREFAMVSFCDTGVGLSDGDIGRIFEPLFTTKPDGAGFGLAACKEIIDRHGGSIDVTQNNEESQGTIFTVNLPLSD